MWDGRDWKHTESLSWKVPGKKKSTEQQRLVHVTSADPSRWD